MVEQYAKHSLLVLFFAIFILLTREKIPGSPCFSVLQETESWVGPVNKATTAQLFVGCSMEKLKEQNPMCVTLG